MKKKKDEYSITLSYLRLILRLIIEDKHNLFPVKKKKNIIGRCNKSFAITVMHIKCCIPETLTCARKKEIETPSTLNRIHYITYMFYVIHYT